MIATTKQIRYERIVFVVLQVEAADFSDELDRNVNMSSGNPLYARKKQHNYVSVLQGQLRYNSACKEAASAKYTYVVRARVCASGEG